MNQQVIETMNEILEHELSGVVRYTHYSLMVFGHNRIPIVKWLREQAHESLTHAEEVGEYITTYEGHPSLKIAKLLETHQHSINDILKESVEHETVALSLYKKLLDQTANKEISLEEFARKQIVSEEIHISEMRKMLKSAK